MFRRDDSDSNWGQDDDFVRDTQEASSSYHILTFWLSYMFFLILFVPVVPVGAVCVATKQARDPCPCFWRSPMKQRDCGVVN